MAKWLRHWQQVSLFTCAFPTIHRHVQVSGFPETVLGQQFVEVFPAILWVSLRQQQSNLSVVSAHPNPVVVDLCLYFVGCLWEGKAETSLIRQRPTVVSHFRRRIVQWVGHQFRTWENMDLIPAPPQSPCVTLREREKKKVTQPKLPIIKQGIIALPHLTGEL